MEQLTPPSHSTWTQVPTGTSPPEMMHVSTVFGSPSSHWAFVVQLPSPIVQPPSPPPEPELLVVSMSPLLDEADPVDALPPVEPAEPVEPLEEPPPAPVPAAWFPVPALQAENTPNRTADPTNRNLVRIPVQARPMEAMFSVRSAPDKTKPPGPAGSLR